MKRFIKSLDHVNTCPFCKMNMHLNNSEYFKNKELIGYECINCSVPNAHTVSGQPYSRYNIGVVKEDFQYIMEETLFIFYKDNKWYNIHNNLNKYQTIVALTEPAREEHAMFGEKPIGLICVSGIIILPFIDSWNLSDEAETMEKLRTYLIFN